jgi:DNA-binding NarL/FixJ family response regulator
VTIRTKRTTRLSGRDAKVRRLHDDGLSGRDIARSMGLPETTVRRALSRASEATPQAPAAEAAAAPLAAATFGAPLRAGCATSST